MQVSRYLGGREDVGMSGDELVSDIVSDFLHREAARLLTGDFCVEDHLEQQITELLSKMIFVSGLDGFDRLGSLLDQVLHQRPMRLLGIPRTLVAQPRHHRNESFKLW